MARLTRRLSLILMPSPVNPYPPPQAHLLKHLPSRAGAGTSQLPTTCMLLSDASASSAVPPGSRPPERDGRVLEHDRKAAPGCREALGFVCALLCVSSPLPL